MEHEAGWPDGWTCVSWQKLSTSVSSLLSPFLPKWSLCLSLHHLLTTLPLLSELQPEKPTRGFLSVLWTHLLHFFSGACALAVILPRIHFLSALSHVGLNPNINISLTIQTKVGSLPPGVTFNPLPCFVLCSVSSLTLFICLLLSHPPANSTMEFREGRVFVLSLTPRSVTMHDAWQVLRQYLQNESTCEW